LAKWVVLQFTLGVFLYVGFPLNLDAANTQLEARQKQDNPGHARGR
jgi:hypothetical protein